MAQISLAATMRAIASALETAGVVDRAYGWPNAIVQPGQAAVAYPEPGDIEFDVTFQRGLEHAVIPVWVVCGYAGEERTLDTVSALLSGDADVKDALDGTLSGTVGSLRVMDASIERYDANPDNPGRTFFVAVKFRCDVLA